MQVKLSGPGTGNIMEAVQALLVAATEACTAYSMKAVKDMQRDDDSLHKRKQKLEAEVRQLEERKRKALAQPAQPQQKQKQPQQEKQQDMRQGTKPLTPEEVEAHRARLEAAKLLKQSEVEAKTPLSHQPFAALALAKTAETQQP